MIIKEKANLKNILIILIIVAIVGGGVWGYYYWRISKEANIKEMNVSAGVVPHHLLAKDLIEDFFSYLSSKEKPETIILLGPDHFDTGNIVGNYFITVQPETQEFCGVRVDGSLIEKLSLKNDLKFSNSSINLDHGITNLVPFVKKYFSESRVVPIIIPLNVSRESTDKFISFLDSLAPLRTVVIASVDFSHYLPESAAEFHDVKSIRTLINYEKADFENLEVDSWQALYIARAFANLRNMEFPKIIGHFNSSDFSEDEDIKETTSYFSVVFERGNSQEAKDTEEIKGRTILFTGDIMLDRGVEYLINKNSVYYPFEKINQFLRGIDIIAGNLEGPIVENPPNFSDESLKFAFSPETIEGLSFANFNLFSLANNHTFNMNKAGLEETKVFLTKASINFVGHPIECDKDFLFEKDNIVFLAFNKTFFFNCSDKEIIELVRETRNHNPDKFLVVIFHWGEEYQSKSSIAQQKLAHQIIDAGADLIIGSHPHVVQEVEEYKEKLIFYSLGNFIFDQYFSKKTQQGLAMGLEIYPEKLVFRLFPIESYFSQPFLMEKVEAVEFLDELAQKSSLQLLDGIRDGIIIKR